MSPDRFPATGGRPVFYNVILLLPITVDAKPRFSFFLPADGEERFWNVPIQLPHMTSMELHFGVIRGKQGIHAALQLSKSQNRQLAVCFNSEGKLIVRICTVIDMVDSTDGIRVILRSQAGQQDSDFTLSLSSIQSIYPIRNFKMEESEASSQLDWPDDPEPNP